MRIIPIILAAGKGTRMKSALPKVLHKVAGKPMISHVLSLVESICSEQAILVVGHGAEELSAFLGNSVRYVVQEPQLGTGHAVMQGMPLVDASYDGVFVVCGDTPLLTEDTLAAMKQKFIDEAAACIILTAQVDNPAGYGRILRNAAGKIQKIVEEKDATPSEKTIAEINTGTYLFRRTALEEALQTLKNENAQGEYYLTDTISYLGQKGQKVESFLSADFQETLGINDQMQLAQADAILRRRKNTSLMQSGVTITDPNNTYIDTDVTVAADTIIEPGCFLRGNTVIGGNCHIGPYCDIKNTKIGSGSCVQHSVMWDAAVGENCSVGPFAYLRPQAVLLDHVKVGDFVEIKKSEIGQGSKVPHLSYVGDATVGEKVNIGCGTITCNYDGYDKHQTVLEDDVFIGSNTNLVAPIKVGKGAFVAAGSTITDEVPADALAVARGKQVIKGGWAEEYRKKKIQK